MALFDQPTPPSTPARRPGRVTGPPPSRRRFKDNQVALFIGILLLAAALAGMMTLRASTNPSATSIVRSTTDNA